MTEQQLINRAVSFAWSVRNINRFLLTNKDVLGLYGVREYVVDSKELRRYYEYHEPNFAWRRWDAFYSEFQLRVEQHLSNK